MRNGEDKFVIIHLGIFTRPLSLKIPGRSPLIIYSVIIPERHSWHEQQHETRARIK